MNKKYFGGMILWLIVLTILTGSHLWAQYYHVTGRVTDPTGSGVFGVDIDVNDSATGDPLDIMNDGTNPSGDYDIVLPTGTFDIEYNAPSGVRLVSEVFRDVVIQQNMVIDVSMEEGYYLSGRVTDGSGAGVNRVDIDAEDVQTGLKIPTPRDNTDANGDYLVVVPEGTFDVTFEPPAGMRLAAGIVTDVPVAGDMTLNISLESGFFVSGWVVGETGAGIEDIDLDFEILETGMSVPTPRDNTAPDGSFTVVVTADTYSILFDPLDREDLAATQLDSVVISSDTVLDTVTVSGGVVLSGHVTDTGGSPVVNADLDVVDPSTQNSVPTPRDNTDETGYYRVTIVPGVYDLVMNPPQGSGLGETRENGVSIPVDTIRDFVLGEATGVEDGSREDSGQLPKGYTLAQNYPNPFNPVTRIDFTIPEHLSGQENLAGSRNSASLEIYNIRGRRVRVLIDEILSPGAYSTLWDGKNDAGEPVSSGMYFYRLRIGAIETQRKMILAK